MKKLLLILAPLLAMVISAVAQAATAPGHVIDPEHTYVSVGLVCAAGLAVLSALGAGIRIYVKMQSNFAIIFERLEQQNEQRGRLETALDRLGNHLDGLPCNECPGPKHQKHTK